MDLKKYINLIKNHNYKGEIGICNYDIAMSANKGDVVLFSRYERKIDDNMDSGSIKFLLNHCTIEKPYDEEEIQKRKLVGNGLYTHSCCVGVPLKYIEVIEI